jgi:hypothetical protein
MYLLKGNLGLGVGLVWLCSFCLTVKLSHENEYETLILIHLPQTFNRYLTLVCRLSFFFFSPRYLVALLVDCEESLSSGFDKGRFGAIAI